jgi:metallopeptidase MepB
VTPILDLDAPETCLCLRAGLTHPQPLLFNDTVQSLQDSARQAADAEKAFVDNLVKTLTTSTVSFDNSIKLYWQHQNELEQQTAKYAFYSTTAAYPDLVDAANDASATYNNATTNTFTNDQFYALVEVVYHQYNPQAKRSDGATGVKSPDTLSTEAKIILQYTMDSFNDNGFALQPQQRDRLSEVQSQIDGLNSDYTNALGNVTGPTIFFTREELDGVSDDRLASLEKDNGRQDGKYGLAPYSDSDVVEVAKNETTRQTIILATQRLVPENIDRLVQIVSLRAEQASLLGEKSYSAYVLKDTLIKSPENVQTLLDQIADKLEPLNDKQYIQPLKDAKEKDTGNSTFLFDWDLSFYKNLLNTAKSTKRDDAAQADRE